MKKRFYDLRLAAKQALSLILSAWIFFCLVFWFWDFCLEYFHLHHALQELKATGEFAWKTEFGSEFVWTASICGLALVRFSLVHFTSQFWFNSVSIQVMVWTTFALFDLNWQFDELILAIWRGSDLVQLQLCLAFFSLVYLWILQFVQMRERTVLILLWFSATQQLVMDNS